jgi:hypothetical protein
MAICTFWRRKRRGSVSMKKVLNHFRFNRHAGFYSQYEWRLLAERIEKKLPHGRKKGILHKIRL